MNSPFGKLLAAAALGSLLIAPLPAQDQAPTAEDDEENIVVTGMRVRQGGAQDIRHFRSIAADVGMPRPESLTVEGLLGEHDLTIESVAPCRQLFCLATETMVAGFATRPDDRLFVGLGFTSNIDADKWQREPLHLVAVVDKSGSMDGSPLDLVRRSLKQIVGQMGRGDRLSIILYGDESHVYLPPTAIGDGKESVLAAIDRIESAGSTNMEDGLKLGYETALAAKAGFAGNTRVMLFTDEQPNVGNTDAGSFMGMASAASARGIGLTTIGVGIQFDGALATRVSSVRGGNLFFISNREEVKSVFEKQLDTMVSELAHDVTIRLRPHSGYRISGIFGVPDGLMTEGSDGAMTITVPTAFLSTNGGGIFLSLAKARDRDHLPAAVVASNTPLLDVDLSYVGAADKRPGSDRLTVNPAAGGASAPMRLAHLLVDEFLVMKAASTAFHQEGDPKKAFRLLSGLSGRIKASDLPGIEGERKLVGEMLHQAAFYSGYSGERPKSLRHLAVVGEWRVTASDGFVDLKQGDRLTFSSDNELVTLRAKPARNQEAEEIEAYQINERQIFLPRSNIRLDYRAHGSRLTLAEESGTALLYLARVEAPQTP